MRIVSLLSFLAVFTYCHSQLSIIETDPVPQSLSALANTGITITFSELLNGATIDDQSFQVFGRWSGPMSGEFTISTLENTVFFDPDRPFFAGEWVTVTLSNTVQSSIGNNLAGGFQYNFWIKTESGLLELGEPLIIEMRETGEGLIQCYGAYAGDINDDEMSDLVVVNENAEDIRILLNNELNGFTDFSIYPIPSSNKPSTNEGADFNGDGYIDIAIGSTQSQTVTLLEGNGSGFENETSLIADVGVRGLTVLDFNGDGWVDIATANRNGNNIALLSNEGDGSFSDALLIDLPCNGETAIAAADFNEDGWLDLVVGCHFSGDIAIVLNNMGVFEISDSKVVNSQPWMLTVGDVNGDGHVDIATANSGSSSLSILMGDGLGGMSDPIYYDTNAFPLAIDLGDLDGDGDLEVITSNYQGANFTLYENDGNGLFLNQISLIAQNAGSCAIFHDQNNDGILDLTCVDELADLLFIYTNDMPVGIGESLLNSISVFPNPASEYISIEGLESKEYLKLIDIQGRVVQEILLNGRYNLAHLAEGIYMVESSVNGIIEKLIIK